MDDSISRQAALDAFGLSEKTRKYGGDHSGYDTRMLYEIQETLENLPSAQPEIIRCKECEYAEQDDFGWFCRSFGCQVGDEYGNGFCADAERREDGFD